MARVFYEATSNATPSTAVPSGPPTLALLVRTVRNMPVAPEVLPKLQSKLLDIDTDVADLAVLIRLDTGLATSVLRVSNSAYYARQSPVTGIEEAVSLIGYQETLRLVARCSYSTVMKSALDRYGIAGDRLWEEAVLTALAMEELCRLITYEVSEGYIAGLLHSIGMVAINDFLVRQRGSANYAPTTSMEEILEWERAAVGFHHGEVGAAMLRQWQFPARLAVALERQYEPQLRPEDSVLPALLPLAATMADHVRKLTINAGTELPAPVFDLDRARRAGLDRSALVETIEQVRCDWLQTRQYLA